MELLLSGECMATADVALLLFLWCMWDVECRVRWWHSRGQGVSRVSRAPASPCSAGVCLPVRRIRNIEPINERAMEGYGEGGRTCTGLGIFPRPAANRRGTGTCPSLPLAPLPPRRCSGVAAAPHPPSYPGLWSRIAHDGTFSQAIFSCVPRRISPTPQELLSNTITGRQQPDPPP